MADTSDKQLASEALSRLTALMEDSGISLDKLKGWPSHVVQAAGEDEINRIYRAALNTPAGRALLVDMITRFCIGRTYEPGGDPSAAVFDAGMRDVVREMIWRANQEETDG